MSSSKQYVAVQPFTLNLDEGKVQVDVKRGDCVLFDGLYVKCRGEKGASRSLVKVVGEWIKLYKGDPAKYAKAMSQQGTLPKTEIPPAPEQPIEPASSRNITGGQILEKSDVSEDIETMNRQRTNKQDEGSYEELQNLVEEYENSSETTEVSSDMDDINKEVTVINSDADIVAQVSEEALVGSDVKNGSSVEVDEGKSEKRVVIAEDSQVVKETNYGGEKTEETAEHTKLEVDTESGGVEVKKVETPAINANEVKTSSVAETSEVSPAEEVVKETSYDESKRTDVGSSTQAQTVSKKAGKSGKKGSKAGGKKTGAKVISGDSSSQGAKVVAKVSKIEEESSDQIITSKVTVGASGETEVGEVEFSSNSDIVEGEATFSSSETTASNVSESDDIDVADLLSDL